MAINATIELLQDIRQATGNQAFIRLMGLSQTSVLAFVIDTTGSMSDDIEEAKRMSFSIIDSRRGTPKEPSEYTQVPFNDPDFGPLTRTADADIFKAKINSLTASGGGDFPEMCLSGLLLALAGAPPSSDIFVFTDASAKDRELKSTVQAMIERTKSTVTFILTDPFSFRRRRDVSQSQQFNSRSIPQSDIQLYRDLAQISGGQTIEVPRATLSQATAVITDASTSALAQPNSTIEPGIPFDLNFILVNNATVSDYTIRARTDCGFSVSFPSSLNVGTEGSAQGTVTLTAPSNTKSGTDVTLTIEAEDPESSDSNYVALRFSVMTKVTDISSPVCQVVRIKADCPVECSTASWELSANLTDGNGTGISGSRAGSCGHGGKCGHMFHFYKESLCNCNHS
ncbi:unnamed protein product [Leuciscus chuanchicus]